MQARDGRADLAVIPSFFPWLQERIAELKKNPIALPPRRRRESDGAARSPSQRLVEMDVPDLARVLAVITLAKTSAVKTMAIEGRTVVPIAEVQRTIGIFINLFKKYVPPERHQELLEELRLETAYDQPLGVSRRP
jgi:hypothetical protein